MIFYLRILFSANSFACLFDVLFNYRCFSLIIVLLVYLMCCLVLQMLPEHSVALETKVKCLCLMNRYEEALKTCNQWVRIDTQVNKNEFFILQNKFLFFVQFLSPCCIK